MKNSSYTTYDNDADVFQVAVVKFYRDYIRIEVPKAGI